MNVVGIGQPVCGIVMDLEGAEMYCAGWAHAHRVRLFSGNH
jgi:hypothetical protein